MKVDFISADNKYYHGIQNNGLTRFLLGARISAVIVCIFMEMFSIHEPSTMFNIQLILSFLFLYNLIAGIYGLKIWKQRGFRRIILLFCDTIVASVIVAVSGGYESPNFAIFLFTMAEASIVLEWRIATGLILAVNGIQVIVTGIQISALQNSLSFTLIESRLFRLLVVGLLFVIFAENLRREEAAHRTADDASIQSSRLNNIFKQLGQAHLNLDKVFKTVFSALETVDHVIFSVILHPTDQMGIWYVAATSNERICPIGSEITISPEHEKHDSLSPFVITGQMVQMLLPPCAEKIDCRQMIFCSMPSYSEEENGKLLICRNSDNPLTSENSAYLQALALQSQLVIHNTLLFSEREERLKQLERFKKIQELFFSAAAHELKTPLTVLDLLLSTLSMSMKNPTKEQKEMMRTMEQNLVRLNVQTRNMLGAARLEASDINLRLKAVDPKRIAWMSVRTQKMVIRDKKIGLKFIPHVPWPRIHADAGRLEDIFSNLLSNAIKFAPEGTKITVSCELRKDDTLFSVCDCGPGVPENDRDRIFERFSTASNADSRAGTGLGLYVVRELVHLHGGIIRLQVASGTTCFRFTIPKTDFDKDDIDE